MNLSEINIYPVKSLKGIALENALVEVKGLQFDRRWMLVDENNQFLTQREFPKMALVEVSVNGESLTVSANGNTLQVPFDATEAQTETATVWGSDVKSEIYTPEINQWFSDLLDFKCKLAVMPQASNRAVEPDFAVRKDEDFVSFADGFPFLLIGENSLQDLNEKLENSVSMNRFRPNFVVSGAEPFAEDNWKIIKIGETIFHVVKPCARCVLTTVDQSKGEKDGKEPLKTLASYRNANGKVLFGQNLIAEKAGSYVKIGDKVEVLETKN